MKKGSILSAIGFVLSAITAHGSVTFSQAQTADERVQVAGVLADMIQKGFVKVDSNGKMQIHSSVIEILENYKLLHESNNIKAMSNCQRTGSGCKSQGE